MDNRTRALSQAVSVDGWLATFDDDGKATVHVDIVFRKGHFGEDPASRVRFKIALRKAEIVVRIPDSEPIEVVRKSVNRTIKNTIATKKSTTETKTSFAASMFAKIGLRPNLSGEAGAEANASASKSTETALSIEEQINCFVEQHIVTPDNHFGWEVSSNPDFKEAYLEGGLWDPVDNPRMKVRALQDSGRDQVSMLVEVRCRREDIEILDLEEKSPEGRALFRGKKNRSVNLAAAEQLIKDELLKAGFLEIPDLSEKDSNLLVADKIILVQED